jgi:zinc and cadmium transporter
MLAGFRQMNAGFLFYLVVIIVTSLAGGLTPLIGDWSRRSLLIPVSFSGGVLLGATFFDMIPESAPILGDALGWPIIAGFLTIFLLERFVLVHPYPEHAGEHGHAHHIHLGLTAYLGLSFHSLLDGLALSSSYQRPELGGVVLLAIIFHKIPDSFALTSLLLLDRWERRSIAIAMLVFACSTPVGALITWIFLHHANDLVIGASIALSAGTFLAVATSDVLPQIRRFNDADSLPHPLWPMVALFAGIAITWWGRLIAG